MCGVIRMGECNLDHSLDDVKKKLESQQPFLPEPLFRQLSQYVTSERSQQILNELFHLLKKYDLAPAEEQEERNGKMTLLMKE